jgi:hypothetical protein
MNRRNFVVGLGTVATISGVASVTAAAFNSDVQPSTDFRIVPDNDELTLQRIQTELSYSQLASGNGTWNDSAIGDFANVTGQNGVNATAFVNDSTDGSLGAELAFNNTNETAGNETLPDFRDTDSADGREGFFEIANLGDTDLDIGMTFGYNGDNVGGSGFLSEGDVADMFTFKIDDGVGSHVDISPSSGNTQAPTEQYTINSGDVEVIELDIKITDDVYNTIQEESGGAFQETTGSIKLLDTVTVGTNF